MQRSIAAKRLTRNSSPGADALGLHSGPPRRSAIKGQGRVTTLAEFEDCSWVWGSPRAGFCVPLSRSCEAPDLRYGSRHRRDPRSRSLPRPCPARTFFSPDQTFSNREVEWPSVRTLTTKASRAPSVKFDSNLLRYIELPCVKHIGAPRIVCIDSRS